MSPSLLAILPTYTASFMAIVYTLFLCSHYLQTLSSTSLFFIASETYLYRPNFRRRSPLLKPILSFCPALHPLIQAALRSWPTLDVILLAVFYTDTGPPSFHLLFYAPLTKLAPNDIVLLIRSSFYCFPAQPVGRTYFIFSVSAF